MPEEGWSGMAGVDVHFSALDRCRTAAKTGATNFETLLEKYPAAATDSSLFGKVAGASALATVIDGVENTVSDERDEVVSKLRGTERALDDVETNIREADKAGEV